METFLSSLAPFTSVNPLSGLVSLDPLLQALQIVLGVVATGLIFLVFWTTRDILKRSRSLFVQLSSILLVAALPVVGFCFYLVFRPSQTIKQREMAENVAEILNIVKGFEERKAVPEQKSQIPNPKSQANSKSQNSNLKSSKGFEKQLISTAT